MLRLFELALQDWRLALTLLSLLPPIFMTLHFVHYMCCTEFDEEEEQQAPQAQACVVLRFGVAGAGRHDASCDAFLAARSAD